MTRTPTVYHVRCDGPSWLVAVEGKPRAREFKERARAISYATAEARMNTPSKVMIHRKDGTILTEKTYRDDPYPHSSSK